MAHLNKNETFVGQCTDYTYDGLGVVKNDTFCYFVKDICLNEVAQIVVTAVKKDYGYGKVLKLLEPSPFRAVPACEISRSCGGCQLQHLSLNGQKQFKEMLVANAINNIGKIDKPIEPIMAMENPYHYRNKIMLPVGKDKNGKTIIGFYRGNSHEIIPFNNCVLQSQKANQLVNKIKELIDKYNLVDSIRHIMIRDMGKTNQLMVVFVTYQKKVQHLNQLVNEMVAYQKDIKSVYQNINDKDTNVVLGKENILLYGNKYVEDELCGLKFVISPNSFYQVNTYQTEVLYNTAIKMAQLRKDDNVLDLYCGVGTIGLIVSKHVKSVTGVEIVEAAVNDGKLNIKNNNINNVELICGDAKIVAKELYEQGKQFDCLFVDPPRKGCNNEAIETIISFNAKKIVYISCNPSTLARDLVSLKEHYNVEKIVPCDMFPQSHHVETIALLVKK